ncbi:MAG: [NiFe]-hydrogenase assembly chaperone HybE [Burkholderiales bacterium]|jgi:[NiFe] hydrogenase assembly HybE family chaperone|nr:[NiFe]-hydrogenase assembly chaperone HybE [Burkholderiales bacterium]
MTDTAAAELQRHPPARGAVLARRGEVDTDPLPACRPSPAVALERAFQSVLQRQMQDMPMLNRALSVEAVGFRPWHEHWLGIMVTPWFMNLMLLPRVSANWQPIAERESRHYVFPAGVFEFIGGSDPVLGDYQACSLFSPMFEFADQGGARATAVAALEALFDTASRNHAEVAAPQPANLAGQGDPAPSAAPAPAARAVSKRDFLFGPAARAERGP